MDMFEPWTQGELKNRAGGAVKDVVARDAERHATQAALAQQQGGVRKEPVILIKHPEGYELQEGWHRTIQHFAQFPNGYTGPAWIAESQTSESWSPMELAIMEGGHLLEEFDSGKNTNEDELIKPRVYLDMDGVLADFFSEWSRLAGVKHYKDINNTEETLQLVREHPTFWIDLPMLPHARALVKTVIEKYGEYRICSTPLAGDERSKPGKIAWIKKHLSDMPPAEIVLTHSKADHALGNGVANILVDDYGVNVNKWRAAGGIGIKYDDSAFDQVAKILGSIAKSGVSK
jgi:5'(3')-deoxyribonucleotidase